MTPAPVKVLVKAKHRTTKGTAFHFSLDRTASIAFYIQRLVHGKYVLSDDFAVKGARAGSHSVAYRIRSANKILPAGTYRVVAAAYNGAWSNVHIRSFRIIDEQVKPKKH